LPSIKDSVCKQVIWFCTGYKMIFTFHQIRKNLTTAEAAAVAAEAAAVYSGSG